MLWHDLIAYVKQLYKSRTVWRREAEAQSRFSTELYIILRSGGWFLGRSVPVPDSIRWHHHAVSIIAEFGELTFEADYVGADIGYSSVSIGEPYPDEEMRGYGVCDIGCLYSTSSMYVDMDGFVYGDGESCSGKTLLRPLARSIDRTLECLLRGLDLQETDICDHKQISLSR